MSQGLHILVVDDEEIVRRSIKLVLEYAGHRVLQAGGSEEALARLSERKFDLVITDFSMPGMRGDQLIFNIRQRAPSQPIIMVSAFAEEYKLNTQGNERPDAMLLKPFTVKTLLESVQQVLEREG